MCLKNLLINIFRQTILMEVVTRREERIINQLLTVVTALA
jgi:hypothetical protein